VHYYLRFSHYNFSNDFREDEAGEPTVPRLNALIQDLAKMDYTDFIATAKSINCIEESVLGDIERLSAIKTSKRKRNAVNRETTVDCNWLKNELRNRSADDWNDEQNKKVWQLNYYNSNYTSII
jgi:hypothetical protein